MPPVHYLVTSSLVVVLTACSGGLCPFGDPTCLSILGDGSGATSSKAALAIVSVSPAGAFYRASTAITVSGTGFQSGMVVSIGNQACASVEVSSPTSLTCVVPAATKASAADVTVSVSG